MKLIIAITIILSILGTMFDLKPHRIKKLDLNSNLILNTVLIIIMLIKVFKYNNLDLNNMSSLFLLCLPTYMKTIKAMNLETNREFLGKIQIRHIRMLFIVLYFMFLSIVFFSNIFDIGNKITGFNKLTNIIFFIIMLAIYIGCNFLVYYFKTINPSE